MEEALPILFESLLVKDGEMMLLLGVDGIERDEFCGVEEGLLVLFPAGFFSRFRFFVTLERRV